MKSMNDERLLKMNIIESPDHDESFKAVDEASAVAFPMDDVLLYGLISKSKKPDDFAVVGKYLSVEPYAIMMRKDEPAFEQIVNRALIDLFPVGEIRRLYAKWFTTRDLTVPMNPYLKEAFAAPNTYPAWPSTLIESASRRRIRRATVGEQRALHRPGRGRRRAATAPSASSAPASRTRRAKRSTDAVGIGAQARDR